MAFTPTFFLMGRAAVNSGAVSLEQDSFAVMLASEAYAPTDAQSNVAEVAPLEAQGYGYSPGGLPLPPMGLTADVPARMIRWGAGAPPVVWPNLTVPDFRWVIGYCLKDGTLIFHGDLGPQRVSEADVTLRWNENGIGFEQIAT